MIRKKHHIAILAICCQKSTSQHFVTSLQQQPHNQSQSPQRQRNEMGNQHSSSTEGERGRAFARHVGSLGLSRNELDKRCQPSG